MPPTLCLNMIVKNEANIIRRCLESVLPFIDYWVIVDTGSTDGTQAIIRQCLAAIPGELHERPWKNFGHNRTEALRLADDKADYALLCDADMVFRALAPDWKQGLCADGYRVVQRAVGGFCYSNIRLVNSRLKGGKRWCYWGVTHEYCSSAAPEAVPTTVDLTTVEFLDLADGGSKQDKFERDAKLLEEELARLGTLPETDTERRALHARTAFYLAQTYRDSGRNADSLAMYQRRAAMGGWDEEVWYSLYQVAVLSERLGLDAATVVGRYLQAYQSRPNRAEPLGQLARYCRERGDHALAHLFAARAIAIAKPTDLLFIDDSYYLWRCLDEYAVSSYWIGQYRESERACLELLMSASLPTSERGRVEANLDFARRALAA